MAREDSDGIGSWSFGGDSFATCHTTLNTYFDWQATPSDPEAAFTWKMEVVRFSGLEDTAGHMTVGRFRTSGGYTQVRLPDDCDFLIILPIHGRVTLHYPSGAVTVDAGQAAVYQSLALDAFEAQPRDGIFEIGFIQLSFAFAQQFLSETLHHPVERDLNLPPLIDASGGNSRLILSLIGMICSGDFYAVGLTISPNLRNRIVKTFSQMLLELLPHRYTVRLQSQQAAPVPNHVRLAQRYLERHIADSPRMSEVARSARVSVRTLEANFRTYLDMTPRTYQRVIRLRRARQALLSSGEARSIAQIALSLGFTHMSRFSKYYADLFGETPSATRKRGERAVAGVEDMTAP